MNKPKVLIVEDEPAIAHEVALNLERRGYDILDVVHSSDTALDLLHRERPDIILLDIAIEGSRNGIELAEIINQKYQLPFVYLTSFSDKDTINQASKTRPYGYLVKPFKDEDIAPAIAMALVKHEETKQTGMPSLVAINTAMGSNISNAEYRVLEMIWQGNRNPEIAEKVFLSVNTVKSHINNIYRKLDINNKTQLLHLLREM